MRDTLYKFGYQEERSKKNGPRFSVCGVRKVQMIYNLVLSLAPVSLNQAQLVSAILEKSVAITKKSPRQVQCIYTMLIVHIWQSPLQRSYRSTWHLARVRKIDVTKSDVINILHHADSVIGGSSACVPCIFVCDLCRTHWFLTFDCLVARKKLYIRNVYIILLRFF